MLDSYTVSCKSAFVISFILSEVAELWYVMCVLAEIIMNVHDFSLSWENKLTYFR